MPLSKSALAYRNNPDSAKKHAEYNTKRNKSKERTAYRVELNRERRKRGIYGKGGPDMSHTESGKLVEEDPSKNRGRNGAGGKSTKKTDSLKPLKGKGKKCGESFIPRNHKCGAEAPSSGITPKKAVILGAGAALGALAAIQARSLWTPALNRLYIEARSRNIPWNTYARKQKADLLDPNVRKLAAARKRTAQRICSSRGDSRTDAWSACQFAIGEPSAYGRVIKHPTQNLVFKVPKEVHYIAKTNGVTVTSAKSLRPRVAKMFEEEASNLQLANSIRVDSPKLVGYNSNKSVIAMEFLDGYDTYRSLSGVNKDLDKLVNFQVFGNMYRMHTNGLVHRDMHSGNILVNPVTRKIAIIDFGHAMKQKDVGLEDFYTEARADIVWVTGTTLNLPRKASNDLFDLRDKHLPKSFEIFDKNNPDRIANIESEIKQRFRDFYQESTSILLNLP